MPIRDRIIFKHSLPLEPGTYPLNLHRSAALFDAQMQNGKLVLWEHHFDNEPAMEVREISIEFTGIAYPVSSYDFREHIATIQQDGLVYHIFETEIMAAALCV